jgi:hypothetical protein
MPMAPTTVEGIEKYLGSGMIRGIGPVYAKKLVRAFGEAAASVAHICRSQQPRQAQGYARPAKVQWQGRV